MLIFDLHVQTGDAEAQQRDFLQLSERAVGNLVPRALRKGGSACEYRPAPLRRTEDAVMT